MKFEGRLAVVGHGTMGTAFVAGLIGREVAAPGQIITSGRREDQRRALGSEFGIRTTADNSEAVKGADVVILAVKPQQLQGVLSDLQGKIAAQALAISIIAGKRIETIVSGLKHTRVVRAMPNLMGQIGEGITGWLPSPEVTEQMRAQAQMILGALGEEVLLDDEKQIDMVTAVSGTGPAYVFEFMQMMIRAGIMIGLPRQIARRLVLATVGAAARYAEKASERHLGDLFESVMSSAGTTAAAYGELIRLGFSHALISAVIAAHNRAKELGQ